MGQKPPKNGDDSDDPGKKAYEDFVKRVEPHINVSGFDELVNRAEESTDEDG
jgi:hypothetical protein